MGFGWVSDRVRVGLGAGSGLVPVGLGRTRVGSASPGCVRGVFLMFS